MKLENYCTIQTIGKLKEQIDQCLIDKEPIEFHASEVEKIDTATLQLILMTMREGKKQDLAVSVVEPSKAFVQAANLLGVSEALSI